MELRKEKEKWKKKAEEIRKKYRAVYQKAWLLIKRRLKWKARRFPSKRNLRKYRQTTLSAEEDLLFCMEFMLTENARKRMKAEMRRKKVDFFAKNRLRKELIDKINPAGNWTYQKVSCLIASITNFRCYKIKEFCFVQVSKTS